MTRKVLIIVHQKSSVPGRIGQTLIQQGLELDIRRPRYGDPLPETMADHAGAVVFGGPMSANDEDDFIRREMDWMAVPLAEDKPLLGVCLGAQLLVRALGGEVALHPEGKAEIGYYPIYPTPAGREMGPWPSHVYQWHRESFSLPRGADLLVTGEMFENQAFRYGKAALALQFHSEMTLSMMHRWLDGGGFRLVLDGARPRHEHFTGRAAHDRGVKQWLGPFLRRWLALGNGVG